MVMGRMNYWFPIYKEMKVTFEKDTRVLHEGEYVAHVYFKDKNDNSFNFYFEKHGISSKSVLVQQHLM